MISKKFFCKDCARYFDKPKYCEEKHGLGSPPYERIAICPICESDNFCEFEIFIEKYDVAEKLLPVVMQLNIFLNLLKDIFGKDIKTENLTSSIEIICELVSEMYDFLDTNIQKKVLKMDNYEKLNRVLKYIEGE